MLRPVITASVLAAIGLGSANSSSGSDCQAHFATEGSFLTGKRYSTWIEFPNLAKADAYTRAYTAIAKEGFQISSADKDAGIISASQSVSFGKGATAPLVIVVESLSPTGSKLTATFRTGGGQAVKAETVRTKLCEYLGAEPAS